tara:strand:- start:43 stop:3324 length:3282 start_codon:yes stop_codon:yes gene_type:complete
MPIHPLKKKKGPSIPPIPAMPQDADPFADDSSPQSPVPRDVQRRMLRMGESDLTPARRDQLKGELALERRMKAEALSDPYSNVVNREARFKALQNFFNEPDPKKRERLKALIPEPRPVGAPGELGESEDYLHSLAQGKMRHEAELRRRLGKNVKPLQGWKRMMLSFMPTIEDREAFWKKNYPGAQVEWVDHIGDYVVRLPDGRLIGGDEEDVTWSDVVDWAGLVPEISASIAAWSIGASRAPSMPQTKAGLLGLSAISIGAGKITGSIQDYLVRKWGLEREDADLGEIAKRRTLESAIELPLTYFGAKWFSGAGKHPNKDSLDRLNKGAGTDDLGDLEIAKNGILAAKALEEWSTKAGSNVPVTKGLLAGEMKPQIPGIGHLEQTAARAAARGGGPDAMRPYTEPLEQIQNEIAKRTQRSPEAAREVQKETGSYISEAVQRVEKDVQAKAHLALSEAEKGVAGAIDAATTAGGKARHDVGRMVRDDVSDAVQEFRKQSRSHYQGVHDALGEAGVTKFVRFKGLGKALKEFEASQLTEMKVKKVDTGLSSLADFQRIMREEVTEVPINFTAEAAKRVKQLRRITKSPQTLLGAQRLSSYLKQVRRAIGTDAGEVGFLANDLNNFIKAIDADIEKSLGDLLDLGVVSKDVGAMYKHAQKYHAQNIAKFNESKLVREIEARVGAGGDINTGRVVQHFVDQSGNRAGDLALFKGLLSPSTYDALRRSIVDAYASPHYVKTAHGEVVDLTGLRRTLNNLDGKYRKELLGGEKSAKALDDALAEFETVYQVQGKIGRPQATAQDLNELKHQIDQGVKNPKAKERIMSALKAEAKARELYSNKLIKAAREKDFTMVRERPELLADELIAGGNAKELERGVQVFKLLGESDKLLQGEVRDLVADAILKRAMSVRHVPISHLKKNIPSKIDASKLRKELFGTEGRAEQIRLIIGDEHFEVFENLAKVLHMRARYLERVGGTGKIATETMFGSRDLGRIAAQIGFGRFALSRPMQAFLARGAKNPEGLMKLWGALGQGAEFAFPSTYQSRSAKIVAGARVPLANELAEMLESQPEEGKNTIRMLLGLDLSEMELLDHFKKFEK